MRIRGRINKSERSLGVLERRGFQLRETRSSFIIDLPPKADVKDGYYLPEMVNPVLLINLAEKGGAKNEMGIGIVVVGVTGKPLYPYYIPSVKNPCGEHAYFSAPEALVTVAAFQGDAAVIIMKHSIEKKENVAYIKSQNIWSGRIFAKIDPSIKCFEGAIRAAKEKSECYNCTCVHYMKSF